MHLAKLTMRFMPYHAAFILLSACSTYSDGLVATTGCDLEITNVHVVTMMNEQVLRDQTVRMESGKIIAIGPDGMQGSELCSEIFDGSNHYLSPGLIDTHIHVESSAFAEAFQLDPPDIDFEAVLALYVAHGVTSVRVMSGAPDILAFRAQSSGLTVPHMVISSPMLSGVPAIMPEPITRVITTAAEGRNAVAEALDAGYDFIKIRSNLDPDVFTAVLDETRQRGTYVDGHITRVIGARAVLESDQQAIAHLDELALGTLGSEDGLKEIVDLVSTCGCFISTTIGVSRNITQQVRAYDTLVNRPEMQFLHPLVVDAFWLPPNNPYLAEGAPAQFFEDLHARTGQLLVSLTEAGAALVAGSDALNPMLIPGASLHDELQYMTEFGLSPYQVLRMATHDPARHVPGFEDAGVLAVGRRADAVLTATNPLDDIGALRSPLAVVLAGRLMDREALDALLASAIPEGHEQ